MNEFGLPQYIAIISIIVTLSGIIIGTDINYIKIGDAFSPPFILT